uniref:CUB domain-containing protein n=1 Tax=Caenorhabditis tropicalis TaxID=1561998 RepID=A0A1I7USV5_9PELO
MIDYLFLVYQLIQLAHASFCPVKHIHSSTPTTGFIESPGYPSPYSASLDCTFNITTAASNVIQLSFVSFDLASKNQLSNQCLNSYLLVVVVDRHGRQHVGERLCGNTVPSPINTMQSWMQVQFVSTSANQKHRGFRIQYRILSEAAIQEPLSSLGEPMFNGCGGHSTPGQLSGEILSPGYPNTYPKNSTCNWLIRVEARQRIYIRIVHLHLAPTIAECERASLTIIDGYKHENFGSDKKESSSETSEAKFCGSQLYYSEEGMKSYLSSANRIVVRLVTQEGPATSMIGEERIGFKIVWTAVEGLIGEGDVVEGGQPCKDQFVCHGGQVCVEQGHGICASRSRLCIHSSLVCDGIHNCVEGDFSDEQHCYSREIITSAALGFSLIVLTMLILVCCDQFRKRRRLRVLIRERRATENGKCNNNNNNNSTQRIQPNR